MRVSLKGLVVYRMRNKYNMNFLRSFDVGMSFALIFLYFRVEIDVKEQRSNLVLLLISPMMTILEIFLGIVLLFTARQSSPNEK
jgi:hypothetical protein